MTRKGILLAGGSGKRLSPLTKYVCKQLLPIYDKPLIYYPLYTLAKCGIKDILVISTPETTPILEKSLGDGGLIGLRISYKVQETPNGIAQAFVLGEEFLDGKPSCLILGDNIFYGNQAEKCFRQACRSERNTVFGYPVKDPSRYGVVEFDEQEDGRLVVKSIEEKPVNPKSHYAIPGIYFFDSSAPAIAKSIKPSARGEYEITSVMERYRKAGELDLLRLGAGNAWLDAGTFDSLIDSGNFVKTMQDRTGVKIGDVEGLAK